tara:strand:+ start:633 stop:2081 length:1449 start_codon:yes stop_codon:yes gene_type:complete
MEKIKIDYDTSARRGIICTSNDSNAFTAIREEFSTKNENASHARRAGARFVPDRLYAITPGRRFEIGLFDDIQKFCTKEQIAKLEPTKEFQANYKATINAHAVRSLSLSARDYQYDMLLAALEQGRGIVEHGTGAGKTFESAALIESYFRHSKSDPYFKCLVVVPNIGLVSQTFDEFEAFKTSFTTTKWTGNNDPDLTTNVVVANTGIIQSRLAENEWIYDVDLLLVDECHGLKRGNKISKIISKIQTPHQYGLTGTIPIVPVDRWSVIGKLGPVIHQKKSKELRDEGHLTKCVAYMLQLSYKSVVPKVHGKDAWKTELDFIYTNEFRNKVITSLLAKFAEQNTLILVNHIAHGEELLEVFTKAGLNVKPFIEGAMPVPERETIIDELENSTGNVVIAMASIFSTGINIKQLHRIVISAGGKAFTRLVQGVGRGLRLHDSKDKLIIIDIVDMLHYAVVHASERKSIYNQEKIPIITKEIVES